MVLSPLTNNPCVLLRVIPVSELLKSYKKNLNIDTSQLLLNCKNVSLYLCKETGYRFFFPYEIAGDKKFYEHLQQFEWYYMPWKWEHKQAASFLKPNMKVLEVGCAKGSFLQKVINEYKVEAKGLELNEKAAKEGKDKGLEILTDTIQEHALQNPGKYDFVCSFQVLEHIGDVYPFIKANVDTLQFGGKLLISVPNNDGFLGIDNSNILNYPPHHMGWWNENSLINLGKIFNLKVVNVSYEPLQEYHKKYFWKVLISKYCSNRYISSFVKKVMTISFFEKFFLLLVNKKFQAFTIQVLYEKRL